MKPDMEPNRGWPERNCEIDGHHWEHNYASTACRYCGADVPRNMTPAWMEE